MGLVETAVGPVVNAINNSSLTLLILSTFVSFVTVAVVVNVLSQLLFKNPHEPPIVFHWFPLIGSTITYGIDPYKFFFKCREKYGDVFTFILLGKKTTVCLGTKGNDFILNGKLKDVNAEEIYSPLTTPVFGKDVVYDCPNSKLMEQKKFVKFGLTTEALRSYVDMMVEETNAFTKEKWGDVKKGTFEVLPTMEELTIYTASRSLQGPEVRNRFDSSFAKLYHDLDMGFSPVNFMLPWAPLPHNRARDIAHNKMVDLYMSIIQDRKDNPEKAKGTNDMITNLMGCNYKNGKPIPDLEIAHMMIALLMAGQHSSASTSSWILLRLSSRPEMWDELYEEQVRVLGKDLPPLSYDNLPELKLHAQIVKETLRIHAPIHSILRKVKSPMPVAGTKYVIPTTHSLLAAPGCTGRMAEYFPEPLNWEPHRWDPGHELNVINEEAADTKEEEEKIDYGYGLVSKGANSPYLPFGAGRHRCIGEQFAYVQLGVILATLARKYRTKNLDGSRDVVATDYSSLFSRPMAPTVVQWERR